MHKTNETKQRNREKVSGRGDSLRGERRKMSGGAAAEHCGSSSQRDSVSAFLHLLRSVCVAVR